MDKKVPGSVRREAEMEKKYKGKRGPDDSWDEGPRNRKSSRLSNDCDRSDARRHNYGSPHVGERGTDPHRQDRSSSRVVRNLRNFGAQDMQGESQYSAHIRHRWAETGDTGGRGCDGYRHEMRKRVTGYSSNWDSDARRDPYFREYRHHSSEYPDHCDSRRELGAYRQELRRCDIERSRVFRESENCDSRDHEIWKDGWNQQSRFPRDRGTPSDRRRQRYNRKRYISGKKRRHDSLYRKTQRQHSLEEEEPISGDFVPVGKALFPRDSMQETCETESKAQEDALDSDVLPKNVFRANIPGVELGPIPRDRPDGSSGTTGTILRRLRLEVENNRIHRDEYISRWVEGPKWGKSSKTKTPPRDDTHKILHVASQTESEKGHTSYCYLPTPSASTPPTPPLVLDFDWESEDEPTVEVSTKGEDGDPCSRNSSGFKDPCKL